MALRTTYQTLKGLRAVTSPATHTSRHSPRWHLLLPTAAPVLLLPSVAVAAAAGRRASCAGPAHQLPVLLPVQVAAASPVLRPVAGRPQACPGRMRYHRHEL
jgi:hypothetical protein